MIAVLLILCFFMVLGGLLRVIAWVAIKLLLPFVGVAAFVLLLIRLLRKKWRPKACQAIVSLVLCAVYIFPILITVNAVPIAYPANINAVKPVITAVWPLLEETVVVWGGDTFEKNLPHAMWGSERWAYDMVIEPYNTNDPDLTSYGIWNKQVVSPVYGTVVAVQDGERDIAPNQDEFESLEGNYVYIKILKTGTYLLLNHLKQGSVIVSVGDTLAPGDVLGRVGNSGTSSEPHLHIHHQRQDPTKTLYPLFAEGLPLYFENQQGIPMPEGGTAIAP